MLHISGECKKEETKSSDRWHRVEKFQGNFLRSIHLPDNAKVDEGNNAISLHDASGDGHDAAVDVYDGYRPSGVTDPQVASYPSIGACNGQLQLTLAMDNGSSTIHVAACTRAQFSRNPTMARFCEVKRRSSLEDSSKGQLDTDDCTCTRLAILVPTRYDHNCHDGDSVLCLAREREAKGKSWKSHSDKDKDKLDRGYNNKSLAEENVMEEFAREQRRRSVGHGWHDQYSVSCLGIHEVRSQLS